MMFNRPYVHIICWDGIVAVPINAIGDDAHWDSDLSHWVSCSHVGYWIDTMDPDFIFVAGVRFVGLNIDSLHFYK